MGTALERLDSLSETLLGQRWQLVADCDFEEATKIQTRCQDWSHTGLSDLAARAVVSQHNIILIDIARKLEGIRRQL